MKLVQFACRCIVIAASVWLGERFGWAAAGGGWLIGLAAYTAGLCDR